MYLKCFFREESLSVIKHIWMFITNSDARKVVYHISWADVTRIHSFQERTKNDGRVLSSLFISPQDPVITPWNSLRGTGEFNDLLAHPLTSILTEKKFHYCGNTGRLFLSFYSPWLWSATRSKSRHPTAYILLFLWFNIVQLKKLVFDIIW